MIWFYVASAIFGGAFVVPMLLGGLDLDTDVEFGDVDGGLDMDMDGGFDAGDISDAGIDPGVDMDMDGGLVDSVGELVASLLSFRSIVMAAAFFGISGIVFTLLGTNSVAVLITAIGLGLFAALTNGWLMQFVTKSEATSMVSNRDMRGAQAEVVLPLSAGRKGRIRATIAGQTEYFTALPYGDKHRDHAFEMGEPVVVIEIDNGTALVVPAQSLES